MKKTITLIACAVICLTLDACGMDSANDISSLPQNSTAANDKSSMPAEINTNVNSSGISWNSSTNVVSGTLSSDNDHLSDSSDSSATSFNSTSSAHASSSTKPNSADSSKSGQTLAEFVDENYDLLKSKYGGDGAVISARGSSVVFTYTITDKEIQEMSESQGHTLTTAQLKTLLSSGMELKRSEFVRIRKEICQMTDAADSITVEMVDERGKVIVSKKY